MNITFAPRGILQIDDARIIFKNFRGEGSKYNREGDRNFALVIPDQEIADALIEQGWNVRIKPPREDGEEPLRYMNVKVKFNDRGPDIYLRSGKARTRLGEVTVGMIDEIMIDRIDMDIRPYDWEVNGNTGRTAYLQSMEVTQRLNRFEERYSREVEEEGVPF